MKFAENPRLSTRLRAVSVSVYRIFGVHLSRKKGHGGLASENTRTLCNKAPNTRVKIVWLIVLTHRVAGTFRDVGF
jgi:hypothetical protein